VDGGSPSGGINRVARKDRKLGHFAVLLGALVILMLMIPLVSSRGVGGLLLRVSFSSVLLAGVYVTSERRWLLGVALTLALPTLAVEWLTHFSPGRASEMVRLALDGCFLFFTAGVQLTTLLRQRLVTTDTVLGGINVYLLLAFAFMMIHALLEVAGPGSYVTGGVSLLQYVTGPDQITAFPTVLYFSFTTMTTLGYGYIVPASGMARMVSSLEAVAGQLYVAILIGRLVALQITSGSKGHDPA